MLGNIAKFRCATTFFSQKMLCLWLAAKFGLAFLLHCCGSQDATGPPGWAVVIYCSRPCFFLGLCFGMRWDSAWKQFEHRVFENCLLRFLGPSIRAESCRQLVAQSAGASGLNRIQMPSCFHSFKQMCFPVGLHKGFVSSFVGEWWWW